MGSTSPHERGNRVYDKPPLSHQSLVGLLRQRGLTIADEERAVRYVRHLGYYRLSPYMIPFRVEQSDRFKNGTTFDNVLSLYVFDRQLRLLALDALERIEVAIRSSLTDHMSMEYESPFWYEKEELFKDLQIHGRFVKTINDMCDRQLKRRREDYDGSLVHQSALEHYLLTYGNPRLPPSWIVVEELTIGQLNSLISNLRKRTDRTEIARPLGINEQLLLSWMRTYVRVRNICAHHGRLWNRVLGVSPALPQSPSVPWLDNPHEISQFKQRKARLYPVLVSFQSLLTTLSPRSAWAQRLSGLLEQYPEIPLEPMGIPASWRDDAFWSKHLDTGVGD